MERLIQLALQYGQGKLTEEALEKARKVLGMSSPQLNINEAGIYGIPQSNFQKLKSSFDPMRMIANQGIKSLMGSGNLSSMVGPGLLMGGALGLGYLTNPLRKGSYNYNPELQGQIDYASGRGFIDRNNSMGTLQYNKDSVLSGQNVISGFGTNDYGKQLQKYIDKMEARKTKGYNTIGVGPFKAKTTGFTDFQQSQLDKAKTELEALTTNDFDEVDKFMETQTGPTYTGTSSIGSGGNNGGGNGGGIGSSRGGGASPGSAGPGGSDAMGSFRRGGIASL